MIVSATGGSTCGRASVAADAGIGVALGFRAALRKTAAGIAADFALTAGLDTLAVGVAFRATATEHPLIRLREGADALVAFVHLAMCRIAGTLVIVFAFHLSRFDDRKRGQRIDLTADRVGTNSTGDIDPIAIFEME